MVDLCPENLSNSFLLQLMRVNQSQQSLLVNTLMANQQRVVSSFLQQQPAALLPNSALENVGIYNRNNLGFQINAQNLLNANTAAQLLMSSNLNTLTAQPILPILSKRTHSASSPTLNYQKNTLEQSLECKRLIRAKLLNGRPRANTSPGTLNLIRKIRPKTQSFHSLSTQKQFRHHPANLPTRNPDACALEEFAAVYLLNSLDSNKPAESKPTVQKTLHVNVKQILDDVLETSQL